MFKVPDPKIETQLKKLFETRCRCTPILVDKCDSCKRVVSHVQGVALRVTDFKALRASTWITDNPLQAKLTQLQTHNDEHAGSILELGEGTEVRVPKIHILSTMASQWLARAMDKAPNWSATLRTAGLDPARGGSSVDLWRIREPVEKLLVPLNLSSLLGTLARGSDGIHWTGVDVGLGLGNETFRYWDSYVCCSRLTRSYCGVHRCHSQ